MECLIYCTFNNSNNNSIIDQNLTIRYHSILIRMMGDATRRNRQKVVTERRRLLEVKNRQVIVDLKTSFRHLRKNEPSLLFQVEL